MPQTLNFNVDIQQGNITSAVQQLQQGVATQLQAGALQVSGMASGMAGIMSSMQQMSGGHAAQGVPYAISSAQVARSLSRVPFEDRVGRIAEYMDKSLSMVTRQAQQATEKFTDLTIPKQPGTIRTFLSSAAGMAMSMLPSYPLFKAGGMIASGVLGRPAGQGGLLGAGLGMGLSVLASPITDSISGFTRALFGGSTAKPGTPEWQQQVSAQKGNLFLGRMIAGIEGTKFGVGGVPYFREKEFTSSMMKIGKELQASKILLGGNVEDYGRLAYMARTYGGAGTSMSYKQFERAFYGSAGRGVKSELADLYKRDLEASMREEARFAATHRVLPGSMNHIMIREQLASGARAPRAIDPWRILGERMGTQYQIGMATGRGLSVGYTKMDAIKDLLLRPEEKRWVGGSLGAGAAYMQSAIENTMAGNTGYMTMAAMRAGKMPRYAFDLPYSASSVLADPKKALEFQYRYNDILRAAGGKGIDAAFRWKANQMVEMAQNFGPYAGVDPMQITTAQLMSGSLTGKPMGLISARAMSAIIHKRGVMARGVGKGAGIADLLLTGGSGALLSATAMDMMKEYTGGRAVTPEVAKRFFESKNFDRAAISALLDPKGNLLTGEVQTVLSAYGQGYTKMSDYKDASQRKIFWALDKYKLLGKIKDPATAIREISKAVIRTGAGAVPLGGVASTLSGTASEKYKGLADLRRISTSANLLLLAQARTPEEQAAAIENIKREKGRKLTVEEISQLTNVTGNAAFASALSVQRERDTFDASSSAGIERIGKNKSLILAGPQGTTDRQTKDKIKDVATTLAQLTSTLRTLAIQLEGMK